jgi:hypothetical protein
MTRIGMVMGTAAYMSPEQAKRKPVDKRADIWAFGCVLYDLLTGARPFDGHDIGDVRLALEGAFDGHAPTPSAQTRGINVLHSSMSPDGAWVVFEEGAAGAGSVRRERAVRSVRPAVPGCGRRALAGVDGRRRAVGMIERGEQLRLALEAREPLGVPREEIREDLEGDIALQLRVAGAIDLAHPARPDGASDLEGPETCPGCKRHG